MVRWVGHGEVGPFPSFRREVMALARYRLEERTRGLHKQCANINLQSSILWRLEVGGSCFFGKERAETKGSEYSGDLRQE